VVSSRVPWHQSARVGASVDSPFLPVRRFDATRPIPEIVAGLNDWQPANLVAYASMARVLSDQVARATTTCECGLPFATLASIEGRTEDVLELAGMSGRSREGRGRGRAVTARGGRTAAGRRRRARRGRTSNCRRQGAARDAPPVRVITPCDRRST
jgi:hypothetical protein